MLWQPKSDLHVPRVGKIDKLCIGKTDVVAREIRVKSVPKVSVIMPVKNGESFLEESIQSILSQTFEDFELVLVDNGSTDKSKDICAKFLGPKVQLVRNEGNQTIADALNLGISIAKGQFIARLDSDDIAEQERLATQVDFLENNPNVGIVGSWITIFGDRSVRWKFPTSDPDIKVSLFFKSPFAHQAVMFRSKWQAGEKGFYDPSFDFAEDVELWTRISRHWLCANIPEYLTRYRTHPFQATRTNFDERQACLQRIAKNYCERFGLQPLNPDSSVKEFFSWWAHMENRSDAEGIFNGARFRRLQGEHFWIWLKGKIRRPLRAMGFLEQFLKARNHLEKLFRK